MKKCLNCGKELTGRQTKSCSKKCSGVHYRKTHKKAIQKYRDNNRLRQKEYNKKYYIDNKDKFSENGKKYYQENKEVIILRTREYNIKNKDKIKETTRKYRETHQDDIKKVKKIYQENNREKRNIYEVEKRNKDVFYKLNHNIGCGIRKYLKTNNLSKNRRHWENVVGYTTQELKEHLESLFESGMTWDNYGKWHIDHIVPRSFFEYSSTDDVEFKYCWSLNNLQPLWAEDNLSKNCKIVKKYLKSE